MGKDEFALWNNRCHSMCVYFHLIESGWISAVVKNSQI